MIRAGILADDENGVGPFKIFEPDAAFADADALLQRDAARFVTHVGAIGQIVGAELPREELIKKRRFVTGATARVKRGRMRRRQRVQFARQQFERVVPIDRLVMRRAFTFYHRMNQPTLQLEPVIGLLLQIRDRMLAQEFWTDLLLRCFAGQRFDAVLAKLEQMSITVRIRPGAALAIEAVLLVDLQPTLNAAPEPGFTGGEFQTFGE